MKKPLKCSDTDILSVVVDPSLNLNFVRRTGSLFLLIISFIIPHDFFTLSLFLVTNSWSSNQCLLKYLFMRFITGLIIHRANFLIFVIQLILQFDWVSLGIRQPRFSINQYGRQHRNNFLNIWHRDLILVSIPTFFSISNYMECIKFWLVHDEKHNFNMLTKKLLSID